MCRENKSRGSGAGQEAESAGRKEKWDANVVCVCECVCAVKEVRIDSVYHHGYRVPAVVCGGVLSSMCYMLV